MGSMWAVYPKVKIVHNVVSDDPLYRSHPKRQFFVDVINDDVAALKLWSFNVADQTYDHEVPFVGPLCCSEGNTIMYGLRLSAEPKQAVRIKTNISIENLVIQAQENELSNI